MQNHEYSLTNVSFRLTVQLPKHQRLFYVIPIIFRVFPFQILINLSKFYQKGSEIV